MSRNTVKCLVQLPQPTGLDLNAHLILEEKPARQEQKLKTLTKYVQRYPQGWKKRLQMAELLYARGSWERAVEEYCRVIERQPHRIDMQLKLGKIFQLMGKKAKAIEVYESALLLAPNDATRHHIKGLIEVCRHHHQKAVKEFELAASLEEDKAAHWLALGQVHNKTENAVATVEAFEKVLSFNPHDIIALIQSHDVLLAVGNFPEAWQRLNRARELAPNDYQVLQRLAAHRCRMRLISGEEGKQTKQAIEKALKLAPHSADVHDLKACYHICRGEWAKGVAVLGQFIEGHPNSPSGWYHYAQCLFHTGDSQAAAEAILKAYKLYPKDSQIYQALCEILPAAGRLEELQPLMEEMLELFPQRWSIWATAGRRLVESFQEIERGCNVSARATQLQPQLADAWFRHGRVLALAQRHQEAVEVLKQGCQLLPEEGNYLNLVPAAVWLGESYRLLGDEAASRHWWQEACERTKELRSFNPATAHYWQGRVLVGLGDVRGAIAAYRTALNQQLLYPARGQVEEALKRLQAMVRKGYSS